MYVHTHIHTEGHTFKHMYPCTHVQKTKKLYALWHHPHKKMCVSGYPIVPNFSPLTLKFFKDLWGFPHSAILFSYSPHIKTFNKRKYFPAYRPYFKIPCILKHTYFFIWPRLLKRLLMLHVTQRKTDHGHWLTTTAHLTPSARGTMDINWPQ